MSEQPHTPGTSPEDADRARQWRLVAGLLGVLLVAAVVTLGVLVASDDGAASGPGASARTLLDAQRGAEQAARKAAVEVTTYDYTSLDTDFSWAATGGTRAFQARYAEVSAPIRTLVLRLEAHAVGTVVAAAATATDADHATVLLFVDQTITNKTNAERKLDQPRMSLTMVREGGVWLVDDLKLDNLTGS